MPPPDYWSIDYRDSRTPSAMGSRDARRTSLLLGGQQIDYAAVTSSPASSNPRRPRSLSPNFYKSLASSSSRHPSDLPRSRLSGDMSDRPLDKIRAEARAADRRHRQRKRATYTDGIDRLDTIGGSYHHGGPFDAALPCRNRIKRYSPLAAVQESNMEAIRATPRENLVDSLSQNVPLQGTATVAPGATDLSGNVMDYVEGPDLMREDDAPGGAYKRWSGIVSTLHMHRLCKPPGGESSAANQCHPTALPPFRSQGQGRAIVYARAHPQGQEAPETQQHARQRL